MRAVIATEPGGPEVLRVVQRPRPAPGLGELLVEVAASAVNRADLLQRTGLYPPPPGASDILGLEAAGTVVELGPGAEQQWRVGDLVMTVLPGGGHAEYAVVPATVALPVPAAVGLLEAAALPEAFLTAYDNVFLRGGLSSGETLLVHGGTSGVGTAAIQLARRAGCRVLVTGSTAGKLAAARALGADEGVDYTREDFSVRARELTDGRGVDVLLDVVGGAYLQRNLEALAPEGRLVVIGLQGGASAEIDLGLLLRRRLSVTASTLRARSTAEKARLAERFRAEVLPAFDTGELRPVVDRILPLEAVAQAHDLMERGVHVGKLVLRIQETGKAPPP